MKNTHNLAPGFLGFPFSKIQKEVYLGHNAISNAYCTSRSIQKLSMWCPSNCLYYCGGFFNVWYQMSCINTRLNQDFWCLHCISFYVWKGHRACVAAVIREHLLVTFQFYHLPGSQILQWKHLSTKRQLWCYGLKQTLMSYTSFLDLYTEVVWQSFHE